MKAVFLIVIFLNLSVPVFGDTLYLKTGEVLQTRVERFSDGAFWVRDGKRTVIFRPDDILKIVFQDAPETTVTVRPGKAGLKPAPKSKASAILTIPPADASSSVESPPEDTAGRGELAILNYKANLFSGIFQILGEVENRMKTDARYVKITVLLMDRDGSVIDQNFAYVYPDPPHLSPGGKKSFRVSFINPPPGVTKYKIRVESSAF